MSKPQNLKFDGQVVNICCHPLKDIIAVGDIDGKVTLHSIERSEEELQNNALLKSFQHHKRSCRRLRFGLDGRRLYSTGKDKSIIAVDVETGKLRRRIRKAHDSPIYSLLVTGDTFIATGDDDGRFKVWDMRTKTAVMDVKESEEFISDMILDEDAKILLATSGEGTLTAFNIRRKRMDTQSELFDSEFLSIAKVKRDRKVICGSGDGILNIFNWDEWGNISDRFPGHPDSIDRIVQISEDVVCTGSMDGKIRAVNILPNKFVGIIGRHEEFPVEDMSLTHDGEFLASCSHDQTVKFWNVGRLRTTKVETTKKRGKKKEKSQKAKNSFFAGLGDSGEGPSAEADNSGSDASGSGDDEDDSDSD